MISEKDLKALTGISDKQHRIAQSLFVLAILFQIFLTFNNLSLAIDYGQAIGLSVEGTLDMWNAEPELQRQYIGYEVQSIHRLNMAILSFGAALLFAIFTVSMSVSRNRNKRVLSALEHCGAIKRSNNA